MLESILAEDTILEKLNQQADIHSLLAEAIKMINHSVNQLIIKVFRKEPHAIKFVIPSLIGKNGPLNDTSVCLKLLYALGIITREEYEDIELLIAILDELDHDDKKYSYLDDEILGPISLLHDMVLPPNWDSHHQKAKESGIVDTLKSSMYQNRYQQMIRSALIIAITDLTVRIINKQNINYFP
ncbi:MltR family transcriptional regulator [Gilliamella apicola]|uniref:MltR family transcriptional regulator n=1 Tax=Gilliamella TaxID=1193503 RepID=UPI000A33D007|nr:MULTISPECIES: MltR family transcriptional regulator [Gilliamella]MBI0027283.1 MltR family transcriptional regulator [Gilliamella sp. B14448G7]MBI0029713.1 MltR family transcriptional regulator [Gilliamella sp. B14384G15]MBI0034076.1 MltR family transcriptional regulator [Gilliamella sp. B14448G11]MBI0041811.1 MltR family transcriptional regulator [Gilliamella sp. B14448G12]MBI0057492.1 MltR family transcriptional regulator [Gilliamella sp. B14384G12]